MPTQLVTGMSGAAKNWVTVAVLCDAEAASRSAAQELATVFTSATPMQAIPHNPISLEMHFNIILPFSCAPYFSSCVQPPMCVLHALPILLYLARSFRYVWSSLRSLLLALRCSVMVY
jgi:hypothetical protein